MILDFSAISANERYFAMVQTIIPRPIAWVLTDSGDKDFNLAPYSFFTGICSDPPLLMLSAGKKPSGPEAGHEKDTRRNIRERKQFVVHIAGCDFLNPLNASAATLDHGESELALQDLSTVPFVFAESGEAFALPRIKHCPVALACELYRLDEIGHTPQAVIYGEIKGIYIDDNAIEKNDSGRLVVDPKSINPLAKLGGTWYSALGELFSVARPK